VADAFFALSPADRRDALEVAAARSGRAVHLLEKDVWVVWTLNALFESEFADNLVFKGGTSLSKAYQAIGRFSEDVDLTYDICAIAPDLAPDHNHAIPSTRSQEQRWTKTIRERLGVWVTETVVPFLDRRLAENGLLGRARAEADTVLLTYEALTSGSGSEPLGTTWWSTARRRSLSRDLRVRRCSSTCRDPRHAARRTGGPTANHGTRAGGLNPELSLVGHALGERRPIQATFSAVREGAIT
jgi:hypothetical protein